MPQKAGGGVLSPCLSCRCKAADADQFDKVLLIPRRVGGKAHLLDGVGVPVLKVVADRELFIRHHDGWLTLHILYGYAAHGNKLMRDAGGYPMGLTYPFHEKFEAERIEDPIHLEFGERAAIWLNRVYHAVGLPDYPSLVSDQARSSMAELELLASIALQAAEYAEEEEYKTLQCAAFDPVEAEWRFADFESI